MFKKGRFDLLPDSMSGFNVRHGEHPRSELQCFELVVNIEIEQVHKKKLALRMFLRA